MDAGSAPALGLIGLAPYAGVRERGIHTHGRKAMRNAFLTLALASAMLVGGMAWTDYAEARPRGWRGGWGGGYYGSYYGGGYGGYYPRYSSNYFATPYYGGTYP